MNEDKPTDTAQAAQFNPSNAAALWLAFVAANVACLGMMTVLLVW